MGGTCDAPAEFGGGRNEGGDIVELGDSRGVTALATAVRPHHPHHALSRKPTPKTRTRTVAVAATLPGPTDAKLSAHALVAALDELGIDNGWVVAAELRAAAAHRGRRDAIDGHQLQVYNHSFRNLVIGRIAEQLFIDSALTPLAKAGFTINDYRGVYENRDFGIEKDGVELPINVKVAGTRFDQARLVGLDPDDCIAINAKSAIHAADPKQGKAPDLILVHLAEFGVRERVDAYMASLTGPEAMVWDLMSWHNGAGLKHAQDQFIDALFARHGTDLLALSDGPRNFRAISAQRVLSVLHHNTERVTQLGARGKYNGESIVHVSKTTEMTPWSALELIVRRKTGIAQVLDGIRHRSSEVVASPSI